MVDSGSLDVVKLKRVFEYDFIRSVACFFVVAVHCLTIIDFTDASSVFYFQIMQAVFFTGNALFFMLSGKFALKQKSDLGKYYKSKVKSILVPMLVFFFIRTVYEQILGINPYGNIFVGFFKNILGGLNDTEYWFLFELIGNIMLAPLLAKAFAAFSDKEHKLISSLIYIFHIFLFVCSIAGIVFCYKLPFTGWSFYFYLGYSLDYIFKKSNAAIYICGAVALVITVLLKYQGVIIYVHDLSPIFTVLAIAMYYFLFESSKYLPNFLKAPTSFIAKHSYSIYLCHMMILDTLFSFIPRLMSSVSILYHILLSIVVMGISLLVAFVIDTFVIKFCQMGVDKVFAYFKKKNAEYQ